jgi:hydroxypyruvate reductase
MQRRFQPLPPRQPTLEFASGDTRGTPHHTGRRQGRGGPNQEYALPLALALADTEGIAALAQDTDGTDGRHGPPGRAQRLDLAPAQHLDDNNSTEFFEKLADLPVSGPTLTNVNDFRAIVVDSP